jgi:small subunit ribosomal protein S15
MAKMHSRARGKSGSTKPVKKTKPSWARYTKKEIEKIITKMAKEGQTPSQIGLHLRDVYGIPNVKVIIGQSITGQLTEKKLSPEIPEDLMALIKRSILVMKHLEANHKDQSAKRGLQLTESKIRRLIKYYKRVGKLAEGWKFDPEKIKLLVG